MHPLRFATYTYQTKPKPDFIAHGAPSAFNLLLYAHQSPSTLTRVFSRQLHFSQNRTRISERKRSRIEEVFHTSWQNHAHIRAFTQTFGSFSHIGVYSVDGRFLRNLHLQFQYSAFSYFLSFSFVLPCCGFQASFSYDDTWMLNRCCPPAFPRATRAPSLGFCCFCFHYSSPPYGSFSHHWYRRTGASFLCH